MLRKVSRPRSLMIALVGLTILGGVLTTSTPVLAVTKLCTQWQWTGLCCETTATNEEYQTRTCYYDNDPSKKFEETRCYFWSLC